MTSDQNPANAYLRSKVMSARPEQLRLMLIEGAVRFARQAREGLETKNYELSYSGVTQCRNIVVELMSGLRDDIDPQLCERVRALYTFLFRELTEANLEKSVERMDNVIELLDYDRQTWEILVQRLASGEEPDASANPHAGHPAQNGSRDVPRLGAQHETQPGGSLSVQA